VDPFAGGGSTIEICKKRFRRYWVREYRHGATDRRRVRGVG
jgi:hypothetical protein